MNDLNDSIWQAAVEGYVLQNRRKNSPNSVRACGVWPTDCSLLRATGLAGNGLPSPPQLTESSFSDPASVLRISSIDSTLPRSSPLSCKRQMLALPSTTSAGKHCVNRVGLTTAGLQSN